MHNVLPTLTKCPECGEKLKELVYGLLIEPLDDEDVVAAGCEIDPMSPAKTCTKCGWSGAPGGRTWPVEFEYTTEEFDEHNPGKPKITRVKKNLILMSDDDLFEFGQMNLEARYELVYRGHDPYELDDHFSFEGSPMPLTQQDAFLVFHNFKTGLIEQVSYFSSHGRHHDYMYLRQGSTEWRGAWSLDEFHDTAFAHNDDTQVWYLGMPEELSDEDFMSEPSNFGSSAIKAMLEERSVTDSELSRQGDLLSTKIFWPHWFNEGLMLARMLR